MDKVLILGGTNFIGRNLIESLLSTNKFKITIYNRGQTNPNLFPELKRIVGDRNTCEINQIFKEHWDFIIDLSCFYPNSLARIINHFNQSLKRYIFISTCSVYDNEIDKSVLRNEDYPTLTCTESELDDCSVLTYGKRKAECERLLQKSGLRYSIFRPVLVYGQYDNTDRLYYWLFQIKNKNDLLIPNKGENLFSVTYVKDLVNAIIKTINVELKSDTYNIITYPKLTISKLILTATNILDIQPKSCNLDSKFLKNNGISEWTDLPLWLDCDYFTYDNSKMTEALKIKLTNFDESIKQTIRYYKELKWQKPIYGISDEIKEKLIAKIKATKVN